MLCIVLTTADLLVFNLRFDNIVAPTPVSMAFAPVSFPYVDIRADVKNQLDLWNYRCTNLHKSGVNSNKNLVFAIPTYTGIIGYMPKRFYNLVTHFGYPKDTILIYPDDSSDSERFLDLSAVQYDFEEDGQVIVRPNALSRLMAFYSYAVIPEETKLLEVLKSDSFNPREKVLLSMDPPGDFFPKVEKPAETIILKQVTRDEVMGLIETQDPALILFSESYDKGWRAFVDGVPTPVYQANYNFMACLVKAGRHEIKFKYQPKSFYVSARITRIGLCVFLLAVMVGLMRRKKNIHES